MFPSQVRVELGSGAMPPVLPGALRLPMRAQPLGLPRRHPKPSQAVRYLNLLRLELGELKAGELSLRARELRRLPALQNQRR